MEFLTSEGVTKFSIHKREQGHFDVFICDRVTGQRLEDEVLTVHEAKELRDWLIEVLKDA
jgi:hypothetical protein